jgi:UDP:flavonoid glycosyltransferase YjiC (YdhE family)
VSENRAGVDQESAVASGMRRQRHRVHVTVTEAGVDRVQSAGHLIAQGSSDLRRLAAQRVAKPGKSLEV